MQPETPSKFRKLGSDSPLVWIVDDSPLEVENARRALSDGFATQTFANGGELLEHLVSNRPPDVLVLDWLMPDLSGIDVCQFLRGHSNTRDLPILLVSRHSEAGQIAEGLAAGANDYLTKPYTPAELLTRVEALVRARQLRDQARAVEQRDAADAVHRTELGYLALLEGMPDLVIVSSQGRIIFMNPLALQTFGDGISNKIIGRPVRSIIPADEWEATAARMEQVSVSGSVPAIEQHLLAYDGSPLTVELSARSAIFDGQVAIVTLARDISERKNAQQQLQVSERMASVGQLAAGIAHEINNPLAAMLANLDFARSELKRLGNESAAFAEIEQALSEATESGQRMKEIVRDVKIFSRSDDPEQIGPLDVHRVLESSLRMAWNEVRHRARLVKDFGPVRPVMGNEARLGQVFLNLIVNAVQALPEGQASKNELRITTQMIADRVAIDVRDTGSGMSPEILKKLFTPFFTTKPVGVGTGLGLSMCHGIVTGLGGEIAVESRVGLGTTFRVLLPSTAAQAEQAPPLTLTLPAKGGRGKVLVIDDEAMVGKAIVRMLHPHHDVIAVSSGQLALDRIAAGQRFDIILCDVMMPEMNGMQLHAQLLLLDPDQAARIVFLSGGAFTAPAREFLDNVSNQSLEKPFDPRELIRFVDARVNASASDAEPRRK